MYTRCSFFTGVDRYTGDRSIYRSDVIAGGYVCYIYRVSRNMWNITVISCRVVFVTRIVENIYHAMFSESLFPMRDSSKIYCLLKIDEYE